MMKELDISVYSSSTSTNLSKLDLENELVSKALDQDLSSQITTAQTADNSHENETHFDSIFEKFCCNFWLKSKSNKKLEQIKQTDAIMNNQSNETLKQAERNDNNQKRLVRVDELVRQTVLDFNSWTLESNPTNSSSSVERKLSNLQLSDFSFQDLASSKNSRSSDLFTKKTRSLATVSSLNSRDEFSLKRALSDICKTQRLSNVSTVSGSFSMRLNEDKELVPVYISKH